MDSNNNGKNPGCFVYLIILVVVIAFFGSCMGDTDKSSKKYSDSYYNDAEYRKNVNDIADVYGESPEDVDRIINDAVDSMNGR